MKGRLMSGMKRASGRPVTSERSIEMPVTPPSMKRLESRKPLSPNAAESMPSATSATLTASRVRRFIRRRITARHARRQTSPSPSNRVGLRVEDNVVEVELRVRGEEEVEVLEGLGEEEALHPVGLLLRHDALERGVRLARPAVSDEVLEHRRAHALVARVALKAVEVVRGLDYLGPQRVAWLPHLHRRVVELLRLYPLGLPHPERRLLKPPRAAPVTREHEHGGEEGVERAVSGRGAAARLHVGVAVPERAAALVGAVLV